MFLKVIIRLKQNLGKYFSFGCESFSKQHYGFNRWVTWFLNELMCLEQLRISNFWKKSKMKIRLNRLRKIKDIFEEYYEKVTKNTLLGRWKHTKHARPLLLSFWWTWITEKFSRKIQRSSEVLRNLEFQLPLKIREIL